MIRMATRGGVLFALLQNDSQQPSFERFRFPISNLAVRGFKGALRRVFRRVSVVQHLKGDAKRYFLIRAHQLIERRNIAALRGSYQVQFFGWDGGSGWTR